MFFDKDKRKDQGRNYNKCTEPEQETFGCGKRDLLLLLIQNMCKIKSQDNSGYKAGLNTESQKPDTSSSTLYGFPHNKDQYQ